MPQMSPYNWLNLNIMFMMIFIMLMMLLYFNYIKKNINLANNKKKNKIFNLKW